jgi:serine/threonine protein phosphatase PrpC
MTEQEQIKALAELDGWKHKPTPVGYWGDKDNGMYPLSLPPLTNLNQHFNFPPYLTSYDAIIPLIQKLDANVQNKFMMLCVGGISNYTPTQLCESLLKATGKWKE